VVGVGGWVYDHGHMGLGRGWGRRETRRFTVSLTLTSRLYARLRPRHMFYNCTTTKSTRGLFIYLLVQISTSWPASTCLNSPLCSPTRRHS
jgi:hypothetical protein